MCKHSGTQHTSQRVAATPRLTFGMSSRPRHGIRQPQGRLTKAQEPCCTHPTDRRLSSSLDPEVAQSRDYSSMPPELDLLAPEVVANPHATFAGLREVDPVHWSERHRAWVLTRYDDVTALFRDLRLSSDRASPLARRDEDRVGGEDPVVSVLARWMVFRDPPDHTRMRRALRPAFTPSAIEALRPTVERVVDELLDGLPEEFDFLAEFAVPLPAIVIAELLGIPREDHDRFRTWSEGLATLVFASGLADRHRRGREALTALASYLGEQLAHRRAQPADDLMGALAVLQAAGELT